jgi:probable HAF family extracellular repeat protein
MRAPLACAARHDPSPSRSGLARTARIGVAGIMLTLVSATGWGHFEARASTQVPAGPAVTGAGHVEAQAAAGAVQVLDLGILPGGYYASARAINNLGQVTGSASDASGATRHVIWTDGTMITAPDWTSGSPEAINDARQIVGHTNLGRSASNGILWDGNGQVFVLPPLPGGLADRVRAHDINASGLSVGRSRDVSFKQHAVVWQGTGFSRDLGFMGSGDTSEAWGINDLGDIVGMANSVSGGQPRGFLWRNGSFTGLDSLTGPSGASSAVDINNSGLIAGTSSGGIAVVWRNGVIETLPALAGGTTYNFVTDLNNNGDVIGYGQSPSGVHLDTAILWRGGAAIDLGRFPGGTFSRAYGINDNGQIVGEGNLVDGGPVHALLWTVGASSGNTTPTVSLAATSATTIKPGGSVSVRGTFNDPDGGPWSYVIDWGNGTTSGTASSPGTIAATRTYASTGRYKVSLTVTDSRSASGTSAPVTVRVR